MGQPTAVLIANRGAIAVRIARTLRRLGVRSIAVFSEADATSRHVRSADAAYCIGPGAARQSYLDVERLLEVARLSGAEAIHPGYGFLSENADFAEACAGAGLTFIGPRPDSIRAFGLKHTARALATAAGVKLAPGSDLIPDLAAAVAAAERIGFPVILKATAGGGGIGMRVCANAREIEDSFPSVQRMGASAFSNDGVFIERFVRRARHVEVQIFGDGAIVIALGERDCSLQRRNQKVVEETPAPGLPSSVRGDLFDAALGLMTNDRYLSAGTVEFLYDEEAQEAYFLEVNTRLQVEHGVTEDVTGVDLVEWMVRGAGGDFAFLDAPLPAPRGASIQARIYAEDPTDAFRPSSGEITHLAVPHDARLETWIEPGTVVGADYDPLLAKLLVRGETRAHAVQALHVALGRLRIDGLTTNIDWLRAVVRAHPFVAGRVSTALLDDVSFQPSALRVLSGGLATTVQSYPGRLGYWDVGVPPSGPMDSLSFRLGNALLGNPADAAGLEFCAVGPTLRFEQDARICLAGAEFGATLDGAAAPRWTVLAVRVGQVLRIGRVEGRGWRGYLLVGGGLDVPAYLGSTAAFTLGRFGGHAARAVAAGDLIGFGRAPEDRDEGPAPPTPGRALDPAARPNPADVTHLRVLLGPHAAPDFFTDADIARILGARWRVHYNSDRTGVRLIGPRPSWARTDGGEAGLHPSNIHDNAYAIGAMDFTGDMPVLLGPDGPSLGGFVCPFVVIEADLWKLGQLAPGLFDAALRRLIDCGASVTEIDCQAYLDAGRLLYAGPWIAERFLSCGAFIGSNPAHIHPVVRGIISAGALVSGADVFRGLQDLAALRRSFEGAIAQIDLLALPTTATIYRVAEVLAEPERLNATLGTLTNAVNLLDLACVACPAGVRGNGTPFGISLIGRAHADRPLLRLAGSFLGPHVAPRPRARAAAEAEPRIPLAVVGAHLAGMPLHWQLSSRDARFRAKTATSSDYALFALADSVPPKPALVHVGPGGRAIELEVYDLSPAAFAAFVAEVPAPLAIGTVELADGRSVKGFVAEPRALRGATDISHHGGWRAYLAARRAGGQ